MKRKIGIIYIFILIIIIIGIVNIKVEAEGEQQSSGMSIPINLGIYNKTGQIWPFQSDPCPVIFLEVFNYSWEVEDKQYKITPKPFYKNEIRGKNGFSNSGYDVLFIGGPTTEYFCGGIPIIKDFPSMVNAKNNLENFIKDGGGYVGTCGGTCYAVSYYQSPRTQCERINIKNTFLRSDPEVNSVKLVYHTGAPIVSEYLYIRKLPIPYLFYNIKPHPEFIGTEAYGLELRVPVGVPLNLKVENKKHPIFRDYHDDTIYMVWGGGPAFKIPYDSDITGILRHTDEEDISKNPDTSVNAWSYRPTFKMLRKLWDIFKPGNYQNIDDFEKTFANLWNDREKWIDWEYTDKHVETNLQSQYALVAIDNYHTPDGGRVVFNGPHPDSWLFDREGRYITNVEDDLDNSLQKRLYNWMDENDTPDDYSDDYVIGKEAYDPDSMIVWLHLREFAWASGKVPDNHMPPIYGRSHVVDLEIYQPSEEFTINCTVGDNTYKKELWDTTNLSLYYKYYETTNQTLTDWIYYTSDYNFPWSFTFDANEAEGPGLYYFCSILNTTNVTDFVECDEFPPGPDTYCFVNTTIAADFTNEPTSPYTNMDITFYDQSLPSQNIISWSWDLGDGNTSTDQNATHQYTENGNYTILLNVTDNESNYHVITKNITVQNRPPSVGFNSTQLVIIGPNDDESDNPMVSFESSSTDSDGNIVNWTWDFGDGTMGYGESVNHTYSEMGYYPVTLRVTDDDNITNEEYVVDCVLVANVIVNKSLTSDDPSNFTWNSIQKGLDNLSTFNLLYILDNTYIENVTINKSVILLGENRDNVIIDGSIKMNNPLDHELINDGDNDFIVNMSGNELLLHFNNDSSTGENYSNSNIVVDSSGQSNNGTIFGATWINPSIKGAGAFQFNGVNNSVNLSCIPALTGENVTISAWIYWKEGTDTSDPILTQSYNTNGYSLFMNNSNGKPTFRLNNSSAISSINLTDGWHHIVGTHNGTSSLLKIYVDGNKTDEVNITSAGINGLAYVGFENISSYFNGTIDEVAIWNRTLSDEEIFMMYHGNYGVSLVDLTVQNGDIGIVPGNHTYIKNCILINNTIGVYLNNSLDVTIESCNISGGNYGIQIFDCNPGIYDRIRVVDCNIVNCNNGLIVNSSSTTSIVGSYFNCSNIDMRFNESNFSTIYVLSSNSADNVAPDDPDLDGLSLGDPGVEYTYSSITNDSNDDQLLYMFDWGDGNTSGWLSLFESNATVSDSHTYTKQGGYYIQVKTKDVFNNESDWSEPILFKTENLSPIINSVNHSSDVVGFGFNVTISANVTDDKSGNYSGIKTVKINITYPDSSTGNFTMNNTENDTYEYTFLDTWKCGQYNYTIWAMDNAYNSNSSSGHSFNVSAQATISVCTIKDEYGNNETVNLTDPPAGSPEIGYELLDDGDVLHIWNRYDSYYFDTNSGIQLTNHYNEYWSQNVLMLGYYNYNGWNLIYRTDELSGFNKNITSGETFVNATIWKDLTYNGYDFRLAIRYHLGVDDNELTVIPYIKNIDNRDIPYVLGFGWEMKDIQIDMTYGGEYISVNRSMYYLDQTLNNVYTDLLETVFYLMENITSMRTKSLYLRWNQSLTYKLQVKSREGQYNAPVTLFVRIGTLKEGQEKYTRMYWYDADQAIFYFNNYSTGEAWETNPGYMVDGSTSNFASTTIDGDIELCNGNNCSGADIGIISKVELRANAYYTVGYRDLFLRPVFNGTTDGDSYRILPVIDQAGWSPWIDITYDPFAPQSWSWSDLKNLDCDVEAGTDMSQFTLHCSKVEIQVTYTPYSPSEISNPYPSNGSNGVSLTPTLNITVSDNDGDSMNITWLSNSSGSWVAFGTNNSVGNGTYHQTMSNVSVNGQWWYWKVNVSDGLYYNESSVFKFYTGYQSKIKNTGSTDIKGYLLIQVQFYNETSESWVVADDTINETTLRTINASDQFGLDTVFNGNLNTTSLIASFGNGTYRIYVAFRDPDGDVLVCDDETLMEDSYEFTVTDS